MRRRAFVDWPCNSSAVRAPVSKCPSYPRFATGPLGLPVNACFGR
jgi:hypothetical protein